MDEPSVQWSEARWNEIREKLGPFLLKSGYGKDDVFYVPISGLTGDNIVQPVEPDRCPWYKGPTLMGILDDLPVEKRDIQGCLRIPVLDKQKD
jgi:peptide chain release factor subunit 3